MLRKDAEVSFLQGAELSKCIRNVCSGREVRCAVAFWGVGIADTLFQAGSNGIKIICDISMGATSQAALRELGAPNNINLKVCHALHAKVYLSEIGAVVGSPNASDNGVGRISGERGKLIETGLFCQAGSSAYLDASEWFDQLFDSSSVVGRDELLDAPEHSCELRAEGLRDVLSGLPLLERLRLYPQNFADVWIAVADEPFDQKRVDKVIKERKRDLKSRGVDIRDNDTAILQNDPGFELRPLSNVSLLLLWHPNGNNRTEVEAYQRCTTWPLSTPHTVFGTKKWAGFWRSVKQKPTQTKLTKEETDQIVQLLKLRKGRWVFTANEFSQQLTKLREPPS